MRDAGQVLQGKVKQYVFISTLSVYASDKDPGQDETAPVAVYKGKDAMKETQETLRADIEALYGPLKALSEKEAEKWFPGITTVIRPGLIVGPGDESDRFTYWPVRLARGGDVLAPGDGKDPVQFVDARDLAEWTIRMVESRTLGVFNAMGPASELTMGGMLDGIQGGHRLDGPPRVGRPRSSSSSRRSAPGATCRSGSPPPGTPRARAAAATRRPSPRASPSGRSRRRPPTPSPGGRRCRPSGRPS